uniref:hypothetical protein n=1 Tax=Brasilonema bromeliae TaxID=383615 RepID=UPI0030DAB880
VRCGGSRATALGGFADLKHVASRCSTCRGFPHERLVLAQRDRRSYPEGAKSEIQPTYLTDN